MVAHPTHLILASASPRRRELMQRMGLQFTVQVADIEEDDSGLHGPEHMVIMNAELKADAVAAQHRESLILGSDTTVAIDGRILSKPDNLIEAKSMLQLLSGRVHSVFTAVALRWLASDFKLSFVERSEVHFKAFDENVIDAYFDLVNPLDKAGAYGIQLAREMIIESVHGSVENVMGLPIQALEEKFAEHAFNFKV